ncbi:MAG: DUF4129 domain-containing protein [Dermabacter sp.]|nr:DUF4129 domain-containing protein [Dermabacter sp.]
MKVERVFPALIAIVCALLFGCATAAHMPPLVDIGAGPSALDVLPQESATDQKAHVNTEISAGFEQYQPEGPNPLGPTLEIIVWALLALARLCLLIICVRVGLRALRTRRTLAAQSESEDTPSEVEASAVAASLQAAAQALERSAVDGNAIVAAWLAIEARLTEEGYGRCSYETSSEFVERVVGSAGLDNSRLARLGGLYRTERYSSAETRPASLEEARDLLRALRGELDTAPAGGARS